MDANYKVGDYSSLDEGAQVTENFATDLVGDIDELDAQIKELNTDDVFKGLACDYACSAYDMIRAVLTNTVDDYQKLSGNLVTTKTNYEAGDKAASDVVTR